MPLTHHPGRSGNACGQPGEMATCPTCPDCRDIAERHSYLILSDDARREMARITAGQVEPMERR